MMVWYATLVILLCCLDQVFEWVFWVFQFYRARLSKRINLYVYNTMYIFKGMYLNTWNLLVEPLL